MWCKLIITWFGIVLANFNSVKSLLSWEPAKRPGEVLRPRALCQFIGQTKILLFVLPSSVKLDYSALFGSLISISAKYRSLRCLLAFFFSCRCFKFQVWRVFQQLTFVWHRLKLSRSANLVPIVHSGTQFVCTFWLVSLVWPHFFPFHSLSRRCTAGGELSQPPRLRGHSLRCAGFEEDWCYFSGTFCLFWVLCSICTGRHCSSLFKFLLKIRTIGLPWWVFLRHWKFSLRVSSFWLTRHPVDKGLSWFVCFGIG